MRLVLRISEDTGSCWYILRAANGKVMMTSEMYSSKSTALRAIKRASYLLLLPWRVQYIPS